MLPRAQQLAANCGAQLHYRPVDLAEPDAAIGEARRAWMRRDLLDHAETAVLQLHHAPFTWGKAAQKSLDNAIALEMCAQMALETLRLNPDAKPLPDYILNKHYLRKHGPGAYYGQGK